MQFWQDPVRIPYFFPMQFFLPLLLALAPQGDHRPLHPVDAPIYFALPDLQGYLGLLEQTSAGRAFAEPAIQAIAEGIGGFAGDQIAEGFSSLSPLSWADSQALTNAATSLSLSLASLGDFELAFALLSGEPTPELASIEMRLVVDFQGPVHATQAFEAIAKTMGAGPPLEIEDKSEGAHRLIHARWTGDEGPRDLCTLRCEGSRLVIFSAASWSRGWQPRPVSGSTRVSLLGEAEGLVLMEAQLDGGLWTDAGPLAQALLPIAEGLFGPYATMLGRGGAWRVQFHRGQYLVDGMSPTPVAPAVLGGSPLAGEPFARTHPEAVVAFTTSLDPTALVRVMQAEGELKGGAAAFLEQLGGRVTLSVPKNVSFLAAPGIQISVPLKDGPVAAKALDVWMESLGVDWGDGLRLVTKSYRRHNLYTLEGITLGDDLPMNMGGMMSPTLVVTQDTLLVLLSATHAKRAVRALAKAKAGPAAPLAGAEWPEGVVEVSHADWIQVIGGIYNSVRGLAGMFLSREDLDETGGDGGSTLGDLIGQLPDAAVFAQHFAPARRWKIKTPRGIRYHSESSFGPELGILSLGAITAFFSLSEED